MLGLTIRWSLADAPAGVEETLAAHRALVADYPRAGAGVDTFRR